MIRPPLFTGAGPDVHDVVGGTDRLLVVLDNDQGVTEVAQPHQCLYQTPVVSLVEPDRGLVQHVEHAHQTRPDLGGKPDSLGFSPRKRWPPRDRA